MAVRRILQLGDPILRLKSLPVSDPGSVEPLFRDLDDTLSEFRRAHGFGRGISAVQVGEIVRVIYLFVEGRPYHLINPEFTWMSAGRFELWDDCFSFPNLMVQLWRHEKAGLRHQDLAGTWHEFEAEGALSELVQHEMDHLDGILAVDRAENCLKLATREEYLRSLRHG